MFGKLGKPVQYTNDILRGVNATVWGGVEKFSKNWKSSYNRYIWSRYFDWNESCVGRLRL